MQILQYIAWNCVKNLKIVNYRKNRDETHQEQGKYRKMTSILAVYYFFSDWIYFCFFSLIYSPFWKALLVNPCYDKRILTAFSNKNHEVAARFWFLRMNSYRIGYTSRRKKWPALCRLTKMQFMNYYFHSFQRAWQAPSRSVNWST